MCKVRKGLLCKLVAGLPAIPLTGPTFLNPNNEVKVKVAKLKKCCAFFNRNPEISAPFCKFSRGTTIGQFGMEMALGVAMMCIRSMVQPVKLASLSSLLD